MSAGDNMMQVIALLIAMIGLAWMGLAIVIEDGEGGYVEPVHAGAFVLLAIIAVLVVFKWPKRP
jgi:hypothetical protein